MDQLKQIPSRPVSSYNPEYVVKSIINAGTAPESTSSSGYPHTANQFLPKDSRVHFHFQTRVCDENYALIDDSRVLGKSVPLIIGRAFKLEIWETLLCSMKLNEISKFRVDKSLVAEYPIVAKCLRDDAEKKEHSTHTCAGFGTGYKDLDQLAYAPQDLEFIIELIKVEYPGEYVKEVWQMSDEEKLSDIPILKEEGNKLYKENNYEAASEKYYLAIAYLQQLILKEVVKEPKWRELKDLEVPLMLNYALCKFKMKEYYETIKHCTTVLEYDDENLKALYRRGEAQIEIWNFGEAKSDFDKVLKLDPSMKSTVEKRLEKIDKLSKEREKSDAFKFKGKLFK